MTRTGTKEDERKGTHENAEGPVVQNEDRTCESESESMGGELYIYI